MRMLFCALALVAVLVTSGCVAGVAPESVISAPLIMRMRGPLHVGDTDVGSSKVGRAKAEGILVVSFGDASISAAAAQGGITKIHHVDNEVTNYFGVYAAYETVVYGE